MQVVYRPALTIMPQKVQAFTLHVQEFLSLIFVRLFEMHLQDTHMKSRLHTSP
jgi:hypothetical protein